MLSTIKSHYHYRLVEDSKLDNNHTGTLTGRFGRWETLDPPQRFKLMALSGEYAGDALVIYSKDDDVEYDDYGDGTAILNQGWNFFITPFDDSEERARVLSIEDYYEKGFKWYLQPTN